MIVRLTIHNLLLVVSSETLFSPGFTILTGESGSGKSVLLSALQLVLGQKLDTSLIRSGSDSASVQAAFDPVSDEARRLLDNAGISHDPAEELIVRRELFCSGKSKSFVNDQAVTLGFLKQLGAHLVNFCGQHAHMQLFEESFARTIVDRFAGHDDLCTHFQELYHSRKKLQQEILEIQTRKQDRQTLLEISEHQIGEIEALDLKMGEDDALYARFCELQKVLELSSTLAETSHLIEDAVLANMRRLKPSFDKLDRAGGTFKNLAATYQQIEVDLKELAYELSTQDASGDEQMRECDELQTRLTAIDRIKKKFGKTIEEILLFRDERKALIEKIGQEGLLLEELQAKEKSLLERENALANTLSQQRKKYAVEASERITHELRQLNMPSCTFELLLTPQNRTLHGDEAIVAYLQANKGLAKTPITEAASGGELSRIMLACQRAFITHTAMNQTVSQEPKCFIFDEIDANIGGTTASVVAQMLLDISRGRQVIAITHFPQVAAAADHHFVISKHEVQDSTHMSITKLSSKTALNEEFSRMLGGVVSLS